MAAEKGLYRSIYSAIWEDPEFQAFDPDMMVVFFSLRTCRECNFPCIFSFYPTTLYERIPQMDKERIDAAFSRLIEAGWIQYERPVLWIVKGFKNEPSRVPKNQKQKDGVQAILNSLTRLSIVTRFREFYGFPAPSSDAGSHTGIHAGMDAGIHEGILSRNAVEEGASKQRTGTGKRTGSGSTLAPSGSGPEEHHAPVNDNPDDTPESRKAFLHETLKDAGLKDLIPGNGQGVSKGKSPRDEFIDSIVDPVMRKALTDVIVNGDEMSLLDKMRHLHAAGFSKETAGKARTLILERGEAAG